MERIGAVEELAAAKGESIELPFMSFNGDQSVEVEAPLSITPFTPPRLTTGDLTEDGSRMVFSQNCMITYREYVSVIHPSDSFFERAS